MEPPCFFKPWTLPQHMRRSRVKKLAGRRERASKGELGAMTGHYGYGPKTGVKMSGRLLPPLELPALARSLRWVGGRNLHCRPGVMNRLGGRQAEVARKPGSEAMRHIPKPSAMHMERASPAPQAADDRSSVLILSERYSLASIPPSPLEPTLPDGVGQRGVKDDEHENHRRRLDHGSLILLCALCISYNGTSPSDSLAYWCLSTDYVR